MEDRQRTLQQNKSIYLYFDLVAEALNDAGLDMETVLKNYKIDVPWTGKSVKEVIWKLAQEKMFGTESTTELTTKQVNEVHEVISRFLAKLGVDIIPFPSIPE